MTDKPKLLLREAKKKKEIKRKKGVKYHIVIPGSMHDYVEINRTFQGSQHL
jgi:hypothetical protein